jgi:hypothetical protein
MALTPYEVVWEEHQRLKDEERHAFGQLQESRAAYGSARHELDENRGTATPEHRNELEEKVLGCQADVEKKTAAYNGAQAAVAQLQLDHVEFADALEKNIPPPQSLMERAAPYIEGTMNAAVGAAIIAKTMTADPMHLPTAEQQVTNPTPAHEHAIEIDLDGLDEALNRRKEPTPVVGNDEAQDSTRIAANDNDPGRDPPAAAARLPANDNTPPLADAVGTQWVSSDKVADDFGAPLPPPPPPPPPEEAQERKLAR